MNRRQFLVGLGGVFAAAVLVKPALPAFAEAYLHDFKFIHPPRNWNAQESIRVLNVIVVNEPTSLLHCRLEMSASPDGPWDPIVISPPPRFVRAAYANGEPLAISYGARAELEAGGQDEES